MGEYAWTYQRRVMGQIQHISNNNISTDRSMNGKFSPSLCSLSPKMCVFCIHYRSHPFSVCCKLCVFLLPPLPSTHKLSVSFASFLIYPYCSVYVVNVECCVLNEIICFHTLGMYKNEKK